ncbi:MAG: hypothetical protein KAS32_00600 [Candidatus Peribacteraceae bacterium]|nr:hypothetical protein [Candidatus Peribacteraceae bacterium]
MGMNTSGLDISLIPKLKDEVIKYWLESPLTDEVYWGAAIIKEAKKRGINVD